MLLFIFLSLVFLLAFVSTVDHCILHYAFPSACNAIQAVHLSSYEPLDEGLDAYTQTDSTYSRVLPWEGRGLRGKYSQQK